jgi:hypothetical protein
MRTAAVCHWTLVILELHRELARTSFFALDVEVSVEVVAASFFALDVGVRVVAVLVVEVEAMLGGVSEQFSYADVAGQHTHSGTGLYSPHI